MKCAENFCISLCKHRNILIKKQNICEQNPFMNYCMIFHYNIHAGKNMFEQHRILVWLQYAVVYFSMNVSRLPKVCMCDVSIYTVQISPFNGRVQKKCNWMFLIDCFKDGTALECRCR